MADNVNVCWALGGYFQRKQLIDKIVVQVSNAKVVNVSEDLSGEAVLDLIKSSDEGIFGMDDQNKVIILNQLPEFKKEKQPGRAWSKVLSNCPPGCVVVFNGIEKSALASLFKLVKKIGKVFDYNSKIDRSEAIEMTEHFLLQDKKKIEPELIAMIVDRVKEDSKIDSDLLYSNLMKLSAYVGKNKTIEKEDIELTVIKNAKFVIWDWFDMMDKKDYHSLMLSMNDLKAKEKISNVLAGALPVFRWRFKLILLVKEGKLKFKESNKVIEKLRDMKKVKDGELVALYSDYSVRGILYGNGQGTPPVDLFNRGQLISILKLIDTFMVKNRYGATECQSEWMFQMLFLFICDQGDVEVVKNVRKYLVG